MSALNEPFVFVDIETTGLDPRDDSLLEVAFLVADRNLTVLDTNTTLVQPRHSVALTRSLTIEFVRGMHERSGLWDALESAEVRGTLPSLAEAERDLIEWYTASAQLYGFDPKQPLCGNSLRLDRAFLAENMPTLDGMFHYRIIDFSSIRELARRRNPAVVESMPEGGQGHRALPDLYDSIAEARHYFETFIVSNI